MDEVRVTAYTEDDEEEVLEVLRASLGATATLPMTSAFWRWKHFENPFGESPIVLGRIGSAIAGVRAYLRWRFRTPGGEVLEALRAVDTATHPDHQRKGVFRTMTLEANRGAEADGYDLIFNTPNEKSLPGYLSMGWSPVGRPALAVRMKRPWTFLGSRQESLPDLTRLAPVAIPDELDERPPIGLRTPRTSGYLRWRFERHPTVDYRMVSGEGGIVITRANLRGGRAEVVCSETIIQSRAPAVEVAREVAADYLVASVHRRAPERRSLLAAGFVPAPRTWLTLVALPLSSRVGDITRIDAWDLSAGDLELM